MSVTYRRNPLTAGRIIDGLAFVVTPDDNRLHTLNSTATFLWELAREGFTLEGAGARLAERYEVDVTTALNDTRICLDDLIQRLILVADGNE